MRELLIGIYVFKSLPTLHLYTSEMPVSKETSLCRLRLKLRYQLPRQIVSSSLMRDPHAHIAFFSFPHQPHVGPTLPIVSVLVRRGYRVTYVTSERFSSRVAELGAEVLICPEFIAGASPGETVGDDYPFHHPFCRISTRTLAKATAFFERNRPSLIGYDLLAFAGRILANRWSIPAIQTSPTFAHSRRSYNQQADRFEILRLVREPAKRVELYLSHHGVSGGEFLFHREGLNIYLFPKALQPNPSTFDASCFFAGRCAGEQPHYGRWKKTSDDGKPIALIATSTTYIQGPEFFRMCIDAFSGLQWHLILSIGDKGNPNDFGPLPPHVEMVQHTSHVKILPHVSLFICLAGIITSAEAMYHGVPLIATTHGIPENEWEAENLVDLGLAVHIRKADMSVEKLRQSVIQISEDAPLRNRVKQMQRIVQREPGAEEAANRIEEYLETRRSHG